MKHCVLGVAGKCRGPLGKREVYRDRNGIRD